MLASSLTSSTGWSNRRSRAVKKVKPNIGGSHLYQLFHSACTPQCHQRRERPAHQSLVNPAGGTRPRLSCALRHRLRRVHQGNRGRELDLRRSRGATSGLVENRGGASWLFLSACAGTSKSANGWVVVVLCKSPQHRWTKQGRGGGTNPEHDRLRRERLA